MSDELDINGPAYRLAAALQAIADAELEYAQVKGEFKERLTRLRNERDQLKREILTGQKQLPLEPTEAVKVQ